MPKLIRFTDASTAINNDLQRLVFLNVTTIVKATYDPRRMELDVVYESQSVRGCVDKARLTGSEAEAALRVLESL